MFWGAFIIGMIVMGQLEGGLTLWRLVLVVVGSIAANRIYRTINPNAPEVRVPPIDEKEEDVHAEAAAAMKDTRSKIRDAQEALRRAREAGSVPQKPPEKSLNFTNSSLKVLRNVLLQHHNMKQTDKSYTDSSLCENTNNVIQQLNNLLDKEKKTA